MFSEKNLKEADKAILAGNYSRLAVLAPALIAEGGRFLISGYLYLGIAYENGDSELEVDIDRAVNAYRQLVLLVPCTESYIYLARAMMKRGNESYGDFHKYLSEARKYGTSAILDLGFAEYYKTKKDPDYALSRTYFKRAALRGRFRGFFGYSECSRLMGQPVNALAVDVLRVMTGWMFYLVAGGKTKEQF